MSTSNRIHAAESSPLQSRVAEAIQRLGFHNTRRITFEIDEATVYLSGETTSYYLKQMAQVMTSYVPGVGRTVNNIRITQANSDTSAVAS